MRKHFSLLDQMRRALGIALVAAPIMAHAQVSTYEYSEFVSTYTSITEADGVLSLGQPVYWPHANNNRAWVNNPFNDPGGQVTQNGYLNPAEGPGYPIGFDFTFNGDVFDVIGISNGGWISFGKSSDGLQAVWVYNWSGTPNGDPFLQWAAAGAQPGPTPTYRRNRVAGFGNSALQQVDWTSLAPPGSYSQVQLATIGTAPNRVCVVQWKDYGLRNDVTVAMNKINFQIRLNEVDNSVDVVMGEMDWVSSLGRYPTTQIGLSGRSNQDFNGRMTVSEEPAFLYDWNNTVPADNNQAACRFVAPQPGQPNGSGIPPVLGRTFRWVPPVCPAPAWPLTITNITFNGAQVSWDANGSAAYDYFVSTANDTNGPEVAFGTVEEAEVYIEGLEAETTYYIFVRSYCDGEPGSWGRGTPFTTYQGGFLACPGTPIEVSHCAEQNSTYYWTYVSEDGVSPVKIDFLGGFRATNGGGSFSIWEGASTTGDPAFNPPAGDYTGRTFTSISPQITIRLVTEAGACQAQPWVLALHWRVGCKDCTDPLVQFTAQEPDCDNNEFSVDVNVFSMGSATTLNLVNTLGLPPTEVSAVGTTYTVGPFPTGTSLSITAEHSENPMCYFESPVLIGLPCAVEDCGPTEYTLCYGDNDHLQRAYRGANGQEIGIRFLEGTIGFGDNVNVYNGADPGEVGPTAVPTLVNTLLTSGVPSPDRTLVLELISDASHSCADADTLFGTSQAWRYVVACYDGCTQPRATFATVCADQTHFNVEVTITELGNTGSVTISNDGGVASTTATAAGTYTVGPFASGTPVKFEVVGASVLCTWASSPMNRSCTGIGIEEAAAHTMALFPNPNDGRFTLELPEAMSGAGELQVLDLAGRMVAQQRLTGTAIQQVDLSALPNGLYALLLRDNGRTFNGKVSIQH
ncbi:MAG: T9SS type A sorting domain-containing protein [Flavobacteriales bacterium]|nr:T9SS type A sorting domain-containing protein [Flavobacteriales bacterium]